MHGKSIRRVALLALSLVVAPAATQGQVNLVRNPSFEEYEAILDDPAADKWWTWGDDTGVKSTLQFDTSECVDGVRSLRVDPKGTANWHFIVLYQPIPQKVGAKYTISFWAKAQASRPLSAEMAATVGSVKWGYTDFQITTDWAEYKFTSVSQNATVKLGIWCAGSEIPLWLDFVNVYEGEYVPGIKPSRALSPRNAEPPIWLPSGHGGQVNAVVFAPDGRTVASGSADNTVQLWRVHDGFRIHKLQGHRGWVMSVAFSPDGTTLASGSEDKTVRLWQVADGRCLKELRGHACAVVAVAFSPDGTTLATGSLDNSVKLWRVSDGAVLRTLTGHGDFVNSVVFSPDGRMLASGGDDRAIRLWCVSDGAQLRALTGHQDYVSCVAFSPDGQRLASGGGSQDKTLRLWRVSDGTLQRNWKVSTNAVTSVAFSPDGTTIAAGAGRSDNSVGLWQVGQDTPLRKLTGHSASVLSVAVSPDGANLVTGSIDKTLRLWRVADGTLVWMTTGPR